MSKQVNPFSIGTLKQTVEEGDFRPKYLAPGSARTKTGNEPAQVVQQLEMGVPDPKDLSAPARAAGLAPTELSKLSFVKQETTVPAVKANLKPKEPKNGTQTS